ncbi:MAG TPA: glycosyltransferase family 39 protein [Dokdonella sp.]
MSLHVARRRQRLAALFVALFALSQALLWWAYYAQGAKPLIGDEAGYQQTALAILAGGPWMPGTIWPPLQPLLLAAVYAVVGPSVLAIQVLQSIFLILCGALLRDLWRRLGGSVAAANTAAALFLLSPVTAAYAQWLWPEMTHLLLLLAALCLLARAPSRAPTFVAGVCIGLAILAKSLLSPFWPVFLLAFVRLERPRLLLQPALLFVIGIGLVTAPALWHGWREYGKPMIADSSVYNLWVGLTDHWRNDYVLDMGGATLPEFLASAPTPQQRNAIYLDKVRTLLAERGLARVAADQAGRQYFRLFSAKTPLLSQLPGPACAGYLSVYATSPWLTGTLTAVSDFFHVLVLAAGAFGLACWRRRPDRLLLIVAVFIAYQLALFLPIHVKARFLLPMLPFLCGFAGSFLAALRERRGPTYQRPATPADTIALTAARLAVGAALAACLLFLAFAGPALDRLCAG